MTTETRKGIISFSITDRGALYTSYLSFVSNGGLFVPTPRAFDIGDEVFMLLQIMDDPSLMPVSARVVWATPPGAQGNKTTGIGVQFSDADKGATKGVIEQHLAAALRGERPTHTM